MVEIVATFACGVFFGAALYINVAQHPASLEAGVAFAGRFFAPMYRRASVLQVAAALIGSAGGAIAWFRGGGIAWLGGALLLFGVIPFTLTWIAPVNDLLLAPGRDPEAPDTEALLRRWAPLHGVRTALSGAAFVLFLVGLGRI
jgi:uncharacterized membrane protein